jgi:hypothetical protein
MPVGGVVRRCGVEQAEAPLRADDYLPSVMTCASYLKLPVSTLNPKPLAASLLRWDVDPSPGP